MDTVLHEIAPFIDDSHLLISIAAGYPIEKMENILGTDKRLVRVMPNTPSMIGAGASGFCLGRNATQEDSDSVKLMMDSVGLSYEVTESQLDAVVGVSGSGPAYVFLFIEALADGAVRMGLPRDIALKLAAQNVLGSAKMVLETGKHPGELKDAVCSPGGTTINAVTKLEELGFRNASMQAVIAAAEKSIALGKI
jgi:pyrroline-5-carboxylate reductase